MRAKPALFVILSVFLLSACGLGNKPEPTAVATDTALPKPTAIPTPGTPLAILVLPADMDKQASDAYQKAVYDLAQSSGMRFQLRNTLTPADLDPSLKVVIALPPDPGIAALAKAAPKVQFLAIDIPNVSPGANISVSGSASQTDIPGFIAGYTAAMLSDDYHAGMLYPKDNAGAQKAAMAFTNGMAYYCGLCTPFFYVPYPLPQFQDIPADEQKSHYPAYADILIVQHKIDTIYVYPDVAAKELTDYLGQTGTRIIGSALPNPKPAMWVMTIRPDETKAVAKAWPDLIAGKGGQTIQSPLGLADVDPALLSPGKERLVQKVLDDLLAGRISTGVSP